MGTFIPDGWVILKIVRPTGPVYKVYGSWYGGYVEGDYWRLNSGITSFERGGNLIWFHGNSGSVYECNVGTEGRLTAFTSSKLAEIRQSLYNIEVEADIISFEQYLKEVGEI